MLDLTNKAFLKTLRMLRIMARRFFRGQKIGARKTNRRGTSVEFSDYKDYNPGDDIRFIDWNIYGRLDRLLIKLFYNEENLPTYVLLDCSTSMNFGSPSKFDYARQIASAVAYVAASNGDVARIFGFGDGLLDHSPKADRAAEVVAVLRYLEGRTSGGRSNLETAVQEFLGGKRRPGVVFVLSDLFLERKDGTRDGTLENGLMRLRYHRHDVNLVHLLTPEEADPQYAGLWEFADSETQERKRLFITTDVLRAYREALDDHCARAARFCHQNRMAYVRTLTDVPFENLVLRLFSAK
jgi:uncharacterized protein (DUF58 family)